MTIKEIRAITGLSQRQFAEKYGLNKRTLQNWEGGANRPPQGFEKLLLRAVLDDQEREAQREGQMKLIEQELYEPNPEQEHDYKKLLELMEKELDIEPSESKYCIYKPENGGCNKCTKPDNTDCNLKCWIHYKDLCK